MDGKTINSFFEAATEIFKEIGFPEADFITDNASGNFEGIIANVGLTGEYNGFLVFKTNIDAASAFIERMLANLGMEHSESGFSQFHKEAIGEIVNQVSGRAVMKLSENSINCNITPPTIITGNNLYFDHNQFATKKSKIIGGEFGAINITVVIK